MVCLASRYLGKWAFSTEVTYSLLVDDLNDGGQFGAVNQHNTAGLDVSPVGGFHGGRHDSCVEKVGESKKASFPA